MIFNFVPVILTFDLQASNLLSCLNLSIAMVPLNYKFLRLFYFEKIGGTWRKNSRTDRGTDRHGSTLTAAS